MKHFVLALGVVLTGASVATADHNRYFPLQDGNRWVYDVLEYSTQLTMEAQTYGSVAYVTSFPTLGDVWLTWSGTTLYAWDEVDGRWESFFRFGVPTGTTYPVSLGQNPIWQNAQVTLAQRYQTVHLERLDQNITNCVRFTFSFQGVADVGLTEAFFARDRGLVFFSQTSILGPVDSELTSAVYNNRNWGLNPVSENLDQGNFSMYPLVGTNRVRLINSQTSWTNFYAQHKPGETAPPVDFSLHTVVVVLAGQRPNSNFSVKVDKVVWNYPNRSVKVFVDEVIQDGYALQVITTPYHIVVLEKKVHFLSSVDWEVIEETADPESGS